MKSPVIRKWGKPEHVIETGMFLDWNLWYTLGETWVMKRVTLSLLLLNHAEFCLPNGSTIGPIVLTCINKGPFWVRRHLEWLFEYSKIMTIPTSKINMFSVSRTLYSGATLALTNLSTSSSENTSGSDCFLIHVSKVQLWKMSWHFSSVSFMCFHCLFELLHELPKSSLPTCRHSVPRAILSFITSHQPSSTASSSSFFLTMCPMCLTCPAWVPWMQPCLCTQTPPQ